ncbi:MAG: dependent oxidoreductase [Crocinitomicaceae bacterium]|jgi:glycine/D-amino acid oxidase-like deaminating enzyme|nr:dependent oxidoreductase [Crocinitomicaceae bacterium]
MNLTTGYPYFLIQSGLPYAYPKLRGSLSTEVVIIGGGISGALTAFNLTESGIPCVLLDERSIGLGSTCASTSLLQYELDTPLCELSLQIGGKNAERAYILSSEAINTLERISRQLDFKSFQRQQSLLFAAYKKDKNLIGREFEARQKAGFEVSLLDEKQIAEMYGFSSPAAILSKQAAITDVYRFTHALLQFSIKKGLQVFDRTSVTKITYFKKSVELGIGPEINIKSRFVVNATGYEITEFIDKKIVSLVSTYAIASEPLEKSSFLENTLLWNTADPYLYMRMTNDKRVIVGGRDEEFYNPQKRDRLIRPKSIQLEQDFKKLFPETDFKMEFSWTGTFGITKDALPYIGTYDKTPHTFYALGFGGNGITFSLIAAELIRDLIRGKTNKDLELFKFDR